MATAITKRRCDPTGRAYAGSQYQVQFYVNEEPEVLNRAIESSFGRQLQLRWVSPLKTASYKEYKDLRFLRELGLSKYEQQLREFWPSGGPSWDALACVDVGSGGVFLVEAKSHIPEMYAGGCKATSSRSIEMIDASLARTKEWLGVNTGTNWRHECQYHFKGSLRKGCLYQAANRMAHLYFLREVLGIEAWFVNICFVNDPRTPTTQAEWESGLAEYKRTMEIEAVPFATDLFLPAGRMVR